LKQALVTFVGVELGQDQAELSRAGQDHVPRSRTPVAVEAARKPPARLDLVHEGKGGLSAAGDKAVGPQRLA
jgi:hypothetical protein